MCVEAFLALDFFRSFCIKCFITPFAGAKRTKEKLGAPVRPLAETPLKFW
jgi:hypothetical protein